MNLDQTGHKAWNYNEEQSQFEQQEHLQSTSKRINKNLNSMNVVELNSFDSESQGFEVIHNEYKQENNNNENESLLLNQKNDRKVKYETKKIVTDNREKRVTNQNHSHEKEDKKQKIIQFIIQVVLFMHSFSFGVTYLLKLIEMVNTGFCQNFMAVSDVTIIVILCSFCTLIPIATQIYNIYFRNSSSCQGRKCKFVNQFYIFCTSLLLIVGPIKLYHNDYSQCWELKSINDIYCYASPLIIALYIVGFIIYKIAFTSIPNV